jgi:hypothetical protein
MKPVFVVMGVLLAFAAITSATFLKQPYLQDLTDTSIVVRWETQTAQSGKVQYGLTAAYGQEVMHSDFTTQHELSLSGLMGDTLYHYRAISGSDTGQDASFHTAVGMAKPFRFIAYGDNRSDSAAHQSVIDRMALTSPAPGFMINVGDLTLSGATSEFQTFFNVEQGLAKRVTLFPGLGNHDTGNLANWTTFFALPGNERWYSFRYGNSAFHCLDNYSPDTVGTPQYNWLLSELLADSADPQVRHVFVFWHEPPYTTNAGHTSNLRIRQYLCPLFERFHVTITFQGHVHCYEHSLVNGVHYLITGGGGAPLSTGWNAPQPWSVYRDALYEFVLVDVRGDSIFSRGIRTDGSGFDTLYIPPRPSGTALGNPRVHQPSLTLAASPNPFSDRIIISFSLPRSGQAKVTLFNVSGQKVATLVDGTLPEGEHQVTWMSQAAPAGVYFCVLRAPQGIRRVRLTKVH